jgi:uncharacterized protein (DUF427 family)
MKAIWNNRIIAESDDVIKIDGHTYFPVQSVRQEYLKDSSFQTVCHWKGTASYYSLEVDGKTNADAAWYYPEPSALAGATHKRIGFWRGGGDRQGLRSHIPTIDEMTQADFNPA